MCYHLWSGSLNVHRFWLALQWSCSTLKRDCQRQAHPCHQLFLHDVCLDRVLFLIGQCHHFPGLCPHHQVHPLVVQVYYCFRNMKKKKKNKHPQYIQMYMKYDILYIENIIINNQLCHVNVLDIIKCFVSLFKNLNNFPFHFLHINNSK